MRKTHSPQLAPITHDRRRRDWFRWLPYVLLGFLLAPLCYELTIVCIARWQALYGPVPRIDTPVLNVISVKYNYLVRLVRRFAQSPFRMLPWKPSAIMLVGLSWAFVTALLLKRRAS